MKGAFAVLMIVVGLMIAGLSGLCTAAFGVSAIASMFGSAGRGAGGLLVLALVIGAPFIGGGVALVWGGLALMRRPKPPRTDVF